MDFIFQSFGEKKMKISKKFFLLSFSISVVVTLLLQSPLYPTLPVPNEIKQTDTIPLSVSDTENLLAQIIEWKKEAEKKLQIQIIENTLSLVNYDDEIITRDEFIKQTLKSYEEDKTAPSFHELEIFVALSALFQQEQSKK